MGSTATAEIDAAVVVQFCSDFLGGTVAVTMQTSLNNEAGIDGIDAMDFIRRFEEVFGVSGEPFRFYDYFQDERTGLTSLILIVCGWLGLYRHQPKDLKVAVLLNSARAKRWVYN